MNLKHLNLDQYSIPEDAENVVFLVLEDLKIQKVFSALAQIGYDECCLRFSLSKLILAYAGFNELSEEIYDFYFRLLERYCEKMEANIIIRS